MHNRRAQAPGIAVVLSQSINAVTAINDLWRSFERTQKVYARYRIINFNGLESEEGLAVVPIGIKTVPVATWWRQS
jgi:hypothetical protein